MEIVGVVGNIQQQVPFGNLGPVTVFPAAYVPASQFGDADFTLAHTWFDPSWIVRTTGVSPSIIDTMQHALREVDPQLPFNKFRTLDDVRGDAVMVARIEALLLGTFAAMALLLCALGVYGLVAQSVVERRRELGVRIALGATPAAVLRTAVTSGVAMALAGTALGLVIAAAVARVMQGLVFGVAVRDPLTFVGATALVMLTACAASIIPAVPMLRLNVATVLNAS
ncbi:MAG: hypothetical protein DMF89_22015 [Acidobacteria bacterium]|nr:MAG: hypothetical protein DMF89_22015 [Acidobacteriota bacterium]